MKLVNKLDRLYSLYIRQRDGRCVTCGTTEKLTNGHLFSRASYSTRWHDLNCNAQCMGCNMLHEHDSQPYTSVFIKKYGVMAWEELHKEYRTPRQFKDWQLQELIDKYEELVCGS